MILFYLLLKIVTGDLYRTLLEGYNKLESPKITGNGTEIQCQLVITWLNDVDASAGKANLFLNWVMEWQDHRLRWDENATGREFISLPVSEIWHPEFYINDINVGVQRSMFINYFSRFLKILTHYLSE